MQSFPFQACSSAYKTAAEIEAIEVVFANAECIEYSRLIVQTARVYTAYDGH